ncbi:MAG: acyltransferase family protein, partial [Lachnospiraceae bacterium]|nr:acyltransferase family protein [Lachnospiraceae bacterium]
MEKKRVYWIDIAKSIAILGVVLQHARGWAYSTDVIYRSLIFAVGLFVMLGGYNITGSYMRNKKVNVLKRLAAIIVPYIFATLLYCIYSGEITDIKTVLMHLVHFDAMAPLYYVAVYSQLVIITPLLILLLKWCDKGTPAVKASKYCGAWIFILAVCYLT